MEKGSFHVKKFAKTLGVAAALFAGLTGVSQASYWDHPDTTIRVNGSTYYGRWAYINERPYVNVETFGRMLGVPRRHDTQNWYLGTEGKPSGSPFQMVVESGTVKLPTARFGGATFVDLQAACQALDIPYHRDYNGNTLEVGDGYRGEYMNGAWQRYSNRMQPSGMSGQPTWQNYYETHTRPRVDEE